MSLFSSFEVPYGFQTTVNPFRKTSSHPFFFFSGGVFFSRPESPLFFLGGGGGVISTTLSSPDSSSSSNKEALHTDVRLYGAGNPLKSLELFKSFCQSSNRLCKVPENFIRFWKVLKVLRASGHPRLFPEEVLNDIIFKKLEEFQEVWISVLKCFNGNWIVAKGWDDFKDLKDPQSPLQNS
jgi:hypothetical protein